MAKKQKPKKAAGGLAKAIDKERKGPGRSARNGFFTKDRKVNKWAEGDTDGSGGWSQEHRAAAGGGKGGKNGGKGKGKGKDKVKGKGKAKSGSKGKGGRKQKEDKRTLINGE